MKNLINVIFTISLLFAVQPVSGQVDLNKTAQSTMNFLLVGNSSRASALGEAYTSIGTGSESIFYNPAGLAVTDHLIDINLNYTQWIADINYLSGSVSWNLQSAGVVGFHLLTVDYGVINGTSIVTDETLYPLGYRDDGPVSNVGAYSVGISYAKSISQEFSIGGTVKLAGQNLGVSALSNGNKDNDANKLVFDAGVLYRTGFKGFVFGMALRNFATDIKREEIEEQLPLIFSLGASVQLMEIIDSEISDDNRILLSADFLHQNNYSERLNLGLEYEFLHMVSLRGGYQTNRDLASWSGGLGFKTSFSDYHLDLNYSYSRFKYFNSVNRISIIFSF